MTLIEAAQAYRDAKQIASDKALEYAACAKELSDAQARFTALTAQCVASDKGVEDAAKALEGAALEDEGSSPQSKA